MGSRFMVLPRSWASHGPTCPYMKPHDPLLPPTSLSKARAISFELPEMPLWRASKTLYRSNSKLSVNLCRAIQITESLQFGLLLENLNEIEDMLDAKDLVALEREILVHIKRLGALKLFDNCLSRNLSLVSNSLKLDLLITDQNAKRIISSGKSRERKLRIRSAEKRMAEISWLNLPIKKLKRVKESTEWSARRDLVAQNEAEMSEGIKVASNLEMIRENMEKEMGRRISYAAWAKAAGIDKKMLGQQLIFGSYCTEKLIKSTNPLIIHIAKNYKGMGIAFDDLIQAGRLGVLSGAGRFDSKKGYKFSTYIRHWIKKSIFELIARYSRIFHLSVRAESMIRRVEKGKRELRLKLLRVPRDDEIAKFTGIPLANVRLARRCSRPIVSFDQCIGHEWSVKLQDIIPDKSVESPYKDIMNQELKESILLILDELSPREKEILVLRYGLDDGRCKTLEEISNYYNVTKEWIRKIEKGALNKLKREDIQRSARKLLYW